LYGGARRRVVPRARLGGNRQSLLRLRYGARPRRKSTGLPARRLLNPVTRGRSLKLTVVIPCYNECSTVAELIERVRAVPIDKQIVVVDDGSTDGTREILAEQPASDELEVHFLPRNAGKGAAVQEALRHVTGDVIVIQDADLEYDPADYPLLLRPIQTGKSKVV